MCGRSSLTKTEKDLEQRFNATFYSDELERYNPLPNFNIAPTHMCPVITNSDTSHLNIFRWGLIPFWAKDEKVGYKMINARMETILEKPTYNNSLAHRRCLVPLDGFYEWKTISAKEKQAYRILTSDQEIFSIAGMWETWKSSSGLIINSFTLITLPANEMMSEIHDRMPAILLKENEKYWLDSEASKDDLISLLSQYPSEKMYAYKVSNKVGNVKERGEELINPIK
jgi:putative SOS response-associated peptidase YedK